jgi:dextranase
MTVTREKGAGHVTIELLPDRAVYFPDEDIVVEVRGFAGTGRLTVLHLGEPVGVHEVTGERVVIGALPPGGYGVELDDGGGPLARTALDVREDPASRLRYGFVADYSAGRDAAPVVDLARRLHMTGIQFYDWAFRHADLLGGDDEYTDPLGRPVSLATVRALIHGVHSVGASALGYAAVYAAGSDEWPTWRHRALLDAAGEPYALGDFLQLVDPAAPDWSAHLTAELTAAVGRLGFDGFHLDQYGYPRLATTPDGAVVDVAESFVTVLRDVRTALPEARLVFNNVNDFPTWRTAGEAQDAVYIEVWPPQVTLESLAEVATRARALAAGKPVVVAAYQHVYADAPVEAADAATALTMATLFSHGATQLLAGEADRILVDPYYVRNHVAEPGTADLLRRWYDFAVEHDELLFDSGIVDVTASYAGSYNDECDVRFDDQEVTEEPRAGAVWRRIVRAGRTLVVHLINLTDQDDTLWDAPHTPPRARPGGRIRLRRVGGELPRIKVADPDGRPRLLDVPVRADGSHAIAELPPLRTWQLIQVEQAGAPS